MTVDPAFKAKLKTIQFGGPKSSQSQMESRWEKDMPAYYRLRRNGLQPKKIDGCAEIETRATTQTEVELGHIFDRKILSRVEEGMAMSREMEWVPRGDTEVVAAAKKRAAVPAKLTDAEKAKVQQVKDWNA